jgi:hypothetical protein
MDEVSHEAEYYTYTQSQIQFTHRIYINRYEVSSAKDARTVNCVACNLVFTAGTPGKCQIALLARATDHGETRLTSL